MRPFLSSREMILVLDNAESILDPRGTNAQDIYAVVDELSQFSNICLCITSRISTIPPTCETVNIPTLSAGAARDAFYRIYKDHGNLDLVDSILGQLDFHPLSITLLATVAHHSGWDTERLSKEWRRQRTDMLHTQHDHSLAATIELSLTSPMFQELGPYGREVLGVVAFFPQGVDENNLEWLFPTLSDGVRIFDNFCMLSLTHRSNGFITMLAPLRDHLCPKDPTSSPLLCTTKDRYFSRLLVHVNPNDPGFEETRWIVSEDVNVEHLLDIFASIDADLSSFWDACAHFINHLHWHKNRLVTLGPKIEGLSDDHYSKPGCLYHLSKLFYAAGNYTKVKQLLVWAVELWREWMEDLQVANALKFLSDANRQLGLHKEGIEEAKEALDIYEWYNDMLGQGLSLKSLAWSLYGDGQFDAAEEAALRAVGLPRGEDDQFTVCECHRILGDICRLRGETGKAITHLETALGIASSFNWDNQLFLINYSLAGPFLVENRFNEAQTHIERAKSHAASFPYGLGRAMELQVMIWDKQRRFEEAKSEALCAADVYGKLGATEDVGRCRALLQKIEDASNNPATPHKSDSNGEFRHVATSYTC